MSKFTIKNKYKKARVGVLQTKHGKINTPNLAIVATHGTIKLLDKDDYKKAKPELTISNTFHLFVNNKVKEIKKAGGIHEWSGQGNPTMTDSGGFQVFSLGWGKVHKIGKVETSEGLTSGNLRRLNLLENQVEIDDNGVVFTYDNPLNGSSKKYKLDAEKSIKIQNDIGADIIFTFDECTSPLHNYTYNKKSLKKTHAWAERSLNKHKKLKSEQLLFGIVQGGVFEDLRKKSSKFIGGLDFDGFGIGGSFGEKQMGKVVSWALSGLPDEKPRHLLGIGKIDDIFIGVENGIDLFDCVIPTREARHGVLYTKKGKVNVRKTDWFKKDKLKAQRYTTIQNIKFYKTLFKEIRQAIKNGTLTELKKEYLRNFR